MLRIVTTSWDDGVIHDLKLADCLASRGLGATFYVPINSYRGVRLESEQLRGFSSQGFEIGAHGIDHEDFSALDAPRAREILCRSKDRLEHIVRKEVSMFCYPNGRYRRETPRLVKEAGYRGGRTTRMLSTASNFHAFEMPTSLQAYPHPSTAYLRNALRAKAPRRLFHYALRMRWEDDWRELGRNLFDEMVERGGIWHLYGHSWEIEQLNLWDALGQMLDYVCRRPGVLYVTNGVVLDLLSQSTLARQ